MGLFSKHKHSSYGGNPPPYSSSASPQPQYAPPAPQSSGNRDSRQLPPGWITQQDPSSGRWFYVYTPTAHRQWEHPIDNPIPGQRGQAGSYQGSQPGYQQPYGQQPYYSPQPQYVQQQQSSKFGGFGGGGLGGLGGGRMGGMGAGMPLAAGLLGGGALGLMAGEVFDHDHNTYVENNYYDDNGGNFGNNDFGNNDFGGGDFGGGDFGGGGDFF
ncbi:hypothetical protein VKS41_008975 [Umbelopsis sp. WA50703]